MTFLLHAHHGPQDRGQQVRDHLRRRQQHTCKTGRECGQLRSEFWEKRSDRDRQGDRSVTISLLRAYDHPAQGGLLRLIDVFYLLKTLKE